MYSYYDETSSSTWSSSSTSLATVNGAGLVTGVSAGDPTISASYSDYAWNWSVVEGACVDNPRTYSGSASCPVAPTVSISGPAYVPLVTGSSQGPNSMNMTASGNPSGGAYSWTTSSSKVSLTNTTSATVTVTAAAASGSVGDVPITVTYTLNGESGTAATNITVEQPTSLSIVSDTTNSTGHTCVGGTGSNTCSQSYFSGSGTYTSYVHNRQYHVMDQLSPSRWIAGYLMQIQESYSAPTGQCSGDSVATGGGSGDTVTDCFYFCGATCQSAGSCSVSATQTITVNGFTVATESVTWTCSGATVSP